MKLLAPYWLYIKWGGILLALLLACRWLVNYGTDQCELEHARAEQSLIDQAVKRAATADKALAEALRKIPKTGQKVSDAVDANPTSPDCRVPDAAADALQDGIRASAASATR